MKTEILYEDKDLFVCYKPAGLPTQTRQIGQMDVESELRNYVKGAPLYIVHRLDQPVEGILAFARTKSGAAALTKQLGSDEMNKSYLALVYGETDEEGVLEDYLCKEAKGNLSKVVSDKEPNARFAQLSYETLAKKKLADMQRNVDPACSDDVLSLVHIRLKTGRHHQIRVQFANAGHPLLADKKYADPVTLQISAALGIQNIALCAHRLHFVHPVTKQKMAFEVTPKGHAFELLDTGGVVQKTNDCNNI
ncbi:MAG: RluA family pseudouridine synthase [Lachnospiraceae bacterium]|nr:RluA family pseudouridine synthase [Lachnospiraceae bacterium]